MLVGEGGVDVGGKQSVKVWDNFECAARPGCAYRPLRSPHVLNQSEKTLSSHIQAARISSLTRACIFRRRQGGKPAMDPM